MGLRARIVASSFTGFLLTALLIGPAAAQVVPATASSPRLETLPAPASSPLLLAPADAAERPEAAERVPGIGGLFREIGGDFKALPSRENALWLGAGLALAAASHPADDAVTQVISGSSRLHESLEAGDTLGGVAVQLGAAVAAYGIGKAAGRPGLARVGADLLRAQVLAQAVTQGVKFAVQRSRPDGSNALSFPSGHTASSFAMATVLQRHYGIKAGLPAYAFAAYVAASRVQRRKHFLSDVAFGATVGILAGRTVTIGRGRARFALAPMATPGGAGLALVHVSR